MSLFLPPTAGNSVGRGAANEPPPPAIDVDYINRKPLRLLRRTMNKRTPKRLNIVPPGQQRGALAPPYSWDALERDDWEYKSSRPDGKNDSIKEALPGHTTSRKPRPSRPARPTRPPHPAPHQAPKQSFHMAPGPAGPKPASPKPAGPNHARIDALLAEIETLREGIRGILSKHQELLQQGKSEMKRRGGYNPGAGHTLAIGNPGKSRYLTIPKDPYRTQTEARAPFGIRPGDEMVGPPLDRRRLKVPNQDWVSPMSVVKGRSLSTADAAALQRHHTSGEAKRDFATSPSSKTTSELVRFTTAMGPQLAQKRERIKLLNQEIKQLRQQTSQPTTESYRLTSNNLRRLSLLLK